MMGILKRWPFRVFSFMHLIDNEQFNSSFENRATSPRRSQKDCKKQLTRTATGYTFMSANHSRPVIQYDLLRPSAISRIIHIELGLIR